MSRSICSLLCYVFTCIECEVMEKTNQHTVCKQLILCVTTVSLRQIGVAYITATSTALATAVGLNLYTKVETPTYCWFTESFMF